MIRWILTACSTIVLVLAGFAVQAEASTLRHAAPTQRGVSAAGEALYEYESLVHQMFGNSISVCTGSGGCHQGWFYKGELSPLAEYSTFTFAFTGFGRSTFHLMPAGYVVRNGFGNYPVPVRINGRLVACSPASNTFLISFGDAYGDGNLACLPPL
jgi:hypothetical protein